MKAAYIRVSSDSQSHDSQRAEIVRYLERHDIDVSKVRWFSDVETGSKISRKGFNELQAEINAGHVDHVTVYHLDRVSRKMIDGMNTIARWAEKGVGFTCTSMDIDFSGIMGQMMAAMLFGFAEMWLKVHKDRQRAGIDVAKAKGVYRGRKPGTTAAKPSRAKTLFAKGLTADEVAEALGVSRRTAWRYLANQS
jgi:DNA invertase Pin-like site-specific DNA recombinase